MVVFCSMTIKTAYQQLVLALFEIYDDREAANIANWVIEAVTGFNKINRIMHPEINLSSSQQNLLENYTAELLQHKPVQYVLKQAWFCGLQFYVNESVLIPRPETEELVAWILEDTKGLNGNIIDIGTGSGCIAIALKIQNPALNVTAIDISEKALEVAEQNAEQIRADVQFKKINILNKEEWTALPEFDWIVSNPPYITLHEQNEMPINVVKYEPHQALFVPDNEPLVFYTTIAVFAKKHLKKNGCIFFEVHEHFANATEQACINLGFKTVLRKDMQGKNRMLKAIKCFE